jgi:hypothetical protein
MVHRTELNKKIAVLTGLSKHTIDRIGVNLNKGGLLLAGGRGRHAPDMGPEDLKNIILAMLGSESTGVVFKTVLKLHAFTAKDGQNFGDILLGICTDHKKAAEVILISVLRNFPRATIYWRDESDIRKSRRQDFTSHIEQEQPGMRVSASLSGNVVRKLVKLVTDPEPLVEISRSE